MTHTIKDFLLVEVPQDAKGLKIFGGKLIGRLQLRYSVAKDFATLPDGNWQYITTSDLITEEQCKEIVEKGFEDSDTWDSGTQYSRTETWITYWCYEAGEYSLLTALDSFHSLLRSLNLKRVAVLKNQENNLLK